MHNAANEDADADANAGAMDGAQEEKPAPKRVNDPRDGPKPTGPGPQRGDRPGVGWSGLPAGALDTRGQPINVFAHPAGTLTRDDPAVARLTLQNMSERWPNYARGTDIHSNDAELFLRELWKERQIPGLSPEDHALYTGEPLIEQTYDVCQGEPKDILDAWGRLWPSQVQKAVSPPVQPGAQNSATPAVLARGILSLPADQRIALGLIVAALQPRQEGAFLASDEDGAAATGGGAWREVLTLAAPVVGAILDGEKFDLLKLAQLVPLIEMFQRSRKGA